MSKAKTSFDRKNHWETIYQTKELTEVSWYQPKPEVSLNFIKESNLDLSAKIIDVGGGDSFLADHLLELGYSNITVLDISKNAINRAKERLGNRADKVNWIVTDISEFHPQESYDLWHDRAVFHFLTDKEDVETYVETIVNHLKPNGHFILGTFATDGPQKCSGIEITQYSPENMEARFSPHFDKIKCMQVQHPTPFNTIQNFTFCHFKKTQ